MNHHRWRAAQFGLSVKTLALVEAARAEGLDEDRCLSLHRFQHVPEVMFPRLGARRRPAEFARRVKTPRCGRGSRRRWRRSFSQQAGDGPKSIQFRTPCPASRVQRPDPCRLPFRQEAAPDDRAAIPALIDLQLEGTFDAIFHSMDEADVIRFIQYPGSMFETDGDPIGFGQGFPHPRSYGSFPRILARYVRDLKALTLRTRSAR